MKSKKIFILLPDGVGLRNFAFTSFPKIGKKLGWDVIFWNQTSFDLSALGYRELKLAGQPRTLTDLLKRAKINAELNYFEEKFDDSIYQTYKFPPSKTKIKFRIKNKLVSILTRKYRGDKGTEELRTQLKISERKGEFYQKCREVLITEKPDYVFCTNQRPITAVAPLTAAQDLGIPTGTFIFSWDNLPKATMVVEPDHYFVWSDHMKMELLKYYPFIDAEKIFVTGSPQFEPHFDINLRKSRIEFFEENDLDEQKEYICYSGDDITTCPDDPQYLEDLAEAVESLNQQEYNLGIIFRRNPVDFSNRYDCVLEKYKNLIIPLAPKWKITGDSWNEVYPTREDLELQINTILHTKAVINLGSSMVFDYAIFDKPCLYIKYDVVNKLEEIWSPHKVYKFVHFRSMPTGEEVYWLKEKNEIAQKISEALDERCKKANLAQTWFDRINHPLPQHASKRIWEHLERNFLKIKL